MIKEDVLHRGPWRLVGSQREQIMLHECLYVLEEQLGGGQCTCPTLFSLYSWAGRLLVKHHRGETRLVGTITRPKDVLVVKKTKQEASFVVSIHYLLNCTPRET
ncbi:unnamed protein product [Boreogadus saida]